MDQKHPLLVKTVNKKLSSKGYMLTIEVGLKKLLKVPVYGSKVNVDIQ